MPVAEDQTGALATAAAAAAAGAAVYGLRKALSSNGAQSMLGHGDDSDDGDDGETGEGGVRSLLATVWDSAQGSISPIADQAAQAAGRWAAEKSPEFVRARIPSFIEAFEEAQ
jgi:hypothetical protein